MKNWKLILLFIVLIISAAAGIAWMIVDFHREEAEKILLMESKDDFDPDEVDALWRFKEENGVSDRYMELYNRKVKHLPGRTY